MGFGLVVVVGAGPGIGRALALRAATAGHPVALVARGQQALDTLAAEVRQHGVPVATATADASRPETIAAAVGRLAAEQPLAVLHYNPSAAPGTLATTPLAELQAATNINVHSFVAAVQAAAPALEATGGSVLATGGGLALHPAAAYGVLAVGKAALRAAVLALAPELAPAGITVATVTVNGLVAPGTAFDPTRIADTLWLLHTRELTGPEIVFRGGAN